MKVMKGMMIFGGTVLLGAGCCHVPPQPAQPHAGAVVVQVVATPKDASAGSLAAAVKAQVEADLAKRGLSVGTPAAADATVTFDVARREAAKLDVWRVYEGTAQARVNATAEQGRLVAAQDFAAKGERAPSEAEAEASAAKALVAKLNPWLAKYVNEKSAKTLVASPSCTCFGCTWIPGYPWFGE